MATQNLIQIKRTAVTGRAANTSVIDVAELALNITDGIMYSTNGTTVFEIGANNTNASITDTLTVTTISANGGVGTDGQVLTSNGSTVYWGDVAAGGSEANSEATNDTSTTTLYPMMVGAAGSSQINKVSTSKLSFNASTGTLSATSITADSATINGNIVLGDGDEIRLGAASDLKIYHSGSASIIEDVGTGNFGLLSNGPDGVLIGKGPLASYEPIIRALPDDGVELYYDNVLKFQTTSAGATANGDLTVTGTITETSSLRYKENISTLQEYGVVDALRPVRYDRKDGSSKGEIGFIAEEVEKIDASLVAYDENQIVDGVHYTRIIPHLVAKIQELEKRLAEVENGDT